tara:strand:- start:1115 stop:1840 length:726 start_codon:yes stop_codon:yes gene_type:complete
MKIFKKILMVMTNIIFLSLLITLFGSSDKAFKKYKIISDSTFVPKDKIVSILDNYFTKESLSINFNDLEKKIKSNPHIKKVTLYKDLTGNLNVIINQFQPIARIVHENKSIKYFDIDGEIFPTSLGYSHRVLLIFLTSKINFLNNNLNNTEFGVDLLNMVKYIESDKFLSKIVSEIEVDNFKNIIIRPQISKQKIIFGYPDDLVNKFRKIKIFYEDIAPAKGWNTYSSVNVKYRNQIICDK